MTIRQIEAHRTQGGVIDQGENEVLHYTGDILYKKNSARASPVKTLYY